MQTEEVATEVPELESGCSLLGRWQEVLLIYPSLPSSRTIQYARSPFDLVKDVKMGYAGRECSSCRSFQGISRQSRPREYDSKWRDRLPKRKISLLHRL